MCHHVYVRLSAEERQTVRKLSGFLFPAYAFALLALFALVALVQPPRPSAAMSASVEVPAANR